MKYRFQFCGVDELNGRPVMDFSHGVFDAPLDEKRLWEPVGMGKPSPEHLLQCSNLQSLPKTGYLANVDWNKDGQMRGVPVAGDLNDNGMFEDKPLTDHDDWGKLGRDGFDGIGLNSFRGCGWAGEDAVDSTWCSTVLSGAGGAG